MRCLSFLFSLVISTSLTSAAYADSVFEDLEYDTSDSSYSAASQEAVTCSSSSSSFDSSSSAPIDSSSNSSEAYEYSSDGSSSSAQSSTDTASEYDSSSSVSALVGGEAAAGGGGGGSCTDTGEQGSSCDIATAQIIEAGPFPCSGFSSQKDAAMDDLLTKLNISTPPGCTTTGCSTGKTCTRVGILSPWGDAIDLSIIERDGQCYYSVVVNNPGNKAYLRAKCSCQ